MKTEKLLKQQIIINLMKNGNKKTCEILLLKSLKLIQKYSFKEHKKVLQLAILYNTPTLKMNKQKLKKKKTKNG